MANDSQFRRPRHDQERDVWHPRWLQGLGQDVRLGLRALRTTPIVTAVAVASLVLGIGANTAVFSLVDSLILRSLPVANPERLAIVSTASVNGYRPLGFRPPFTYATFDQIRQRTPFDGTVAFTTCCSQSIITVDGVSEPVDRQFFSGNFFETLGVRAGAGRLFLPADDVTGGGRDGQVVVISDRLWTRRFGRAAGAIGSPLKVDHASLAIVGVLPPDFLGLEVGRAIDIALPLHAALEPADFKAAYDPHVPVLNIVIRRRPGQTLDQAVAALRAAQPDIRTKSAPSRFNAGFLKDSFTLESIAAGTSALRRQFERPLLLVLAVVMLVLLIACANIANLLLARCTSRKRELSVRVALGASRWRLARQLFVESFVLSALGTAGGVFFAPFAVRLLVSTLSASSTPVVLDSSVDWRMGLFTAGVMCTAAMVFGIAPALRAARMAPMDALKDRTSGGRAGGDVARGLVVAQVALSLMLVVAAGLFVRTFEQLARVPLGFDRDRVLGVTVNTQAVPATDRQALYHRLVRAAGEVPGVASAGGSINPPLAGFLVGDFVVSEPGVKPGPEAERISQSDFVTPGSFAGYGIAIRAGRDVDGRDTKDSLQVMLVNEAFVRRFLPSRNAVGAVGTVLAVTARLPGDFPLGQKTIVGVVGDAVYHSMRQPAAPAIYMPLAQYGPSIPQPNLFVAVRSAAASPSLLQRGVAAALTSVNPNLTLAFRPLADRVDGALAQDRLVAMLSGFFGALALLLAALGLYGVMSYAVTRRRTELGIRLALGASPRGIVRLVLSRVSMLIGTGVAIGVLLSLWASTFVATLVYGVRPRDPAIVSGAVIVLIAVGTFAAWLPAWRASRMDPATTLRCE
jgi:putative ABC transport system permease protein